VQREPEEVTLVQMLRLSTDHDAAMYAADFCDLMKRVGVLYLNLHQLP
jgi:hypothetical protein